MHFSLTIFGKVDKFVHNREQNGGKIKLNAKMILEVLRWWAVSHFRLYSVLQDLVLYNSDSILLLNISVQFVRTYISLHVAAIRSVVHTV